MVRWPALIGVVALVGCKEPVDHYGPWRAVSDRREADLTEALERARAGQELPGLAMAVAFHDDHTLWTGATGSANLDPSLAWEPRHTSRIGSVTKTFTAAIVHQLIAEGRVQLDDPLERWVPGGFTGVTVRQLLGHSSGIVSYNYVGGFDTSRAYTPQELVDWAYVHEPTLRFTPGTRFEYSNTNYVLLGLVIEAATEDTYAHQLQTRLFDPLQLGSMRLSGSGEPVDPALVHCYSAAPMVDTSDVDPSFGWAAGSIVSDAGDLARWNDALYLGDVLDEAGLDAMITPAGLTGPDETPYGLGAFHEQDDTYTSVGHTGGMAGYLTYAYTLLDPPATVVVMANRSGVDLREAAGYGWGVVLDVEIPCTSSGC